VDKALRYTADHIQELLTETFNLDDLTSELDVRVHANNQPFIAPRAEVYTRWEGIREQRRIDWGLEDSDAEAYHLDNLVGIKVAHEQRLDGVRMCQACLDLPPSYFDSDRAKIRASLEAELANQHQAYQTEKRILAEEREMLSRGDQEAMEVELRGVSEGMLAPLGLLQLRNVYLMYKNNPIMLRYYFLY
jgi:hypothetical protein